MDALFIVNLIAGITISLFGIISIVLSLMVIRTRPAHSWVYIIQIAAGAGLTVSFGFAVIDALSGGAGVVPPILGRPSVLFEAFAGITLIILNLRRGGC